MTIPVVLQDGSGSSFSAKISSNGELIVRPIEFSSSRSVIMDLANTAFNVWGPVTGKEFVATSTIISTNKDIGVNGTNIEIYESDAPDSITVNGDSTKMNLLKNTVVPITGLLNKIPSGKYLNGKHDDAAPNAEVFLTIGGYFVPMLI